MRGISSNRFLSHTRNSQPRRLKGPGATAPRSNKDSCQGFQVPVTGTRKSGRFQGQDRARGGAWHTWTRKDKGAQDNGGDLARGQEPVRLLLALSGAIRTSKLLAGL